MSGTAGAPRSTKLHMDIYSSSPKTKKPSKSETFKAFLPAIGDGTIHRVSQRNFSTFAERTVQDVVVSSFGGIPFVFGESTRDPTRMKERSALPRQYLQEISILSWNESKRDRRSCLKNVF